METIDLELESVRPVEGIGWVMTALGGSFHCWTDEALLADRARSLMDRPARLALGPERVAAVDSGPRLHAITELPLPPSPDVSFLRPLDFARRRGNLRGRRLRR